jgi:hypothetical protein
MENSQRLTEKMLLAVVCELPYSKPDSALANFESLMRHFAGKDLGITEEVLLQAAKIKYGGCDIMRALLQWEHSNLQITSAVLEKAERHSNTRTLRLLVERTKDEIVIPENLLLGLVKSTSIPDLDLFDTLSVVLGKHRHVQITEEVLVNASSHQRHPIKLLEILFERQPDVQITEKPFASAALNGGHSVEVLEFLFDKRRHVHLTARVLEVAVTNTQKPIETLELILRKRPYILMTENVLWKAATQWEGDKILSILLKHQPNARITKERLEDWICYGLWRYERAIRWFVQLGLVEAEMGARHSARAREQRRAMLVR